MTKDDPKLGPILASDGRTLYQFEKDQGTTTACTGACTNAWPALMATGTPQAAPGINPAQLSSAHGQVTYAGHLLYFFSGDHAPGDTNGLGIPDWSAVSPAGERVSPMPDHT
jgi:predicted lipoprotein with Yx(FWY)xxD motif